MCLINLKSTNSFQFYNQCISFQYFNLNTICLFSRIGKWTDMFVKKKILSLFFCRMLSMVHCTSLGSYCTHRWSDRQLVGTGSESPRNSSPRLARSCWSCMMSPPSSSTTSSCLPVEKITSLKRVGLNLLCSLFRFIKTEVSKPLYMHVLISISHHKYHIPVYLHSFLIWCLEEYSRHIVM